MRSVTAGTAGVDSQGLGCGWGEGSLRDTWQVQWGGVPPQMLCGLGLAVPRAEGLTFSAGRAVWKKDPSIREARSQHPPSVPWSQI